MDFHATRRVWESGPPVPAPAPHPRQGPARHAAPPGLPPRAPVEDASSSDYSELGDYSADADFYVPGVNDVERAEPVPHPAVDTVDTAFSVSAVSAARGSSSSATREWLDPVRDWPDAAPELPLTPPSTSGAEDGEEGEEEDAGEDEDEGGVEEEDKEEAEEEGLEEDDDDATVDVVRQHSNFSKLSAQSWLTVDSAQDVDVSARAPGAAPEAEEPTPPDFPLRARGGRAPSLRVLGAPAGDDRDPATLFAVDVGSDLMAAVQTKPLREMSVFECCAVLQAGVAAYKKKSFRRFGARRVWLSPDCDRLFWTSKKDGVFTDHIKLQKVAKMKCVEREVCVDVTEGYRISLLFANPDEAGLWVRALSCRIPLQARIRAPRDMVPPDKEREDYTLTDDVFNGRPLREYTAVNSYVALCCAKGQPQSLGNKLAFSRSDASFCGLRYVPHKHVPLMLRSPEEVAVLKRLDHPNIVKYHECLRDTEYGGNYVIFEHLARGSLIDASKLEGVKPIPEKPARELMRDILSGLKYLHELRIAHGDIRPDNLLRAVNGEVKINAIGCITHDFTEITNAPALTRVRLGDASPAFLAPEQCWMSDAPPAHAKSYAMDVWSVAVVLYFMLYGRVPFGGRDNEAIQESICKSKLRFPRYPETSRKVRSLLKGILGAKDPKTRIPLAELLRHPWFVDNEEVDGVYQEREIPAKLIVSPEEVDSAIQIAKVRERFSARR